MNMVKVEGHLEWVAWLLILLGLSVVVWPIVHDLLGVACYSLGWWIYLGAFGIVGALLSIPLSVIHIREDRLW